LYNNGIVVCVYIVVLTDGMKYSHHYMTYNRGRELKRKKVCSDMFEPLNSFWGKDAHMLHTGMSIEGFNFIALMLLC
jgi:hypothetical protein